MTTVIKTFFAEPPVLFPEEINKKLGMHYTFRENKGLRGKLYEIRDGDVVLYGWNSFEIFTRNSKENYEIRSELEKMLNIKLLEPN